MNAESGFEIKPVYDAGDDSDAQIGRPGEYPYTRGVYSTMYTTRPWTMRQYAGFGTAAESNARYHELLKWVPMTGGKLQFQSEAAEVFYRNIEIRPIPAMPGNCQRSMRIRLTATSPPISFT